MCLRTRFRGVWEELPGRRVLTERSMSHAVAGRDLLSKNCRANLALSEASKLPAPSTPMFLDRPTVAGAVPSASGKGCRFALRGASSLDLIRCGVICSALFGGEAPGAPWIPSTAMKKGCCVTASASNEELQVRLRSYADKLNIFVNVRWKCRGFASE